MNETADLVASGIQAQLAGRTALDGACAQGRQ
jgi:hypothetical protein